MSKFDVPTEQYEAGENAEESSRLRTSKERMFTEPVGLRELADDMDRVNNLPGAGADTFYLVTRYVPSRLRACADLIERLSGTYAVETSGCPHCREVYRIWEANRQVDPSRVAEQMRDAALVGMFRPSPEKAGDES